MSTKYEDLADEYYDEQAHPTIALLRAGSREALAVFSADFFKHGGRFAEVGSGRGTLHTVGTQGTQIVSFDASVGMLRRVPGAAVVADATSLPVRDAVFDGAFASLCDPYNTTDFLRESRRVLKLGARLLLTVPDYRWVRHNQAREGVTDAAVVVSRTGPVIVPSFVYSRDEQVALLNDAGFSHVEVHNTRLASVIAAIGVTSARLLDTHGRPISPFVTNAYLAR